MADTEDGLFELDRTREAQERLATLARETSGEFPSPEASALRDVLSHVVSGFSGRSAYARDDEYALREVQFLVDLRREADRQLTMVVGEPETLREATWRRIGDVLGISRQAAHERYAKRTVRKSRQ